MMKCDYSEKQSYLFVMSIFQRRRDDTDPGRALTDPLIPQCVVVSLLCDVGVGDSGREGV